MQHAPTVMNVCYAPFPYCILQLYCLVCACQVLLDAGVKEEKIMMLCLVAAPEGIHKVSSAMTDGWVGYTIMYRRLNALEGTGSAYNPEVRGAWLRRHDWLDSWGC